MAESHINWDSKHTITNYRQFASFPKMVFFVVVVVTGIMGMLIYKKKDAGLSDANLLSIFNE